MARNGLSLRAVNYMRYLQKRLTNLNLSKILLMVETAIFFEDNRTQTVDVVGVDMSL